MAENNVVGLTQKDKWNFIFKYGVLFWGLSAAAISILIKYFVSDDSITLKDFVAFITFPIMGIFGGCICGDTRWTPSKNSLVSRSYSVVFRGLNRPCRLMNTTILVLNRKTIK